MVSSNKSPAATQEPERHILCCEWCGENTMEFGRGHLKYGAGMYLVLCAFCTLAFAPDHLNHNPDGEARSVHKFW